MIGNGDFVLRFSRGKAIKNMMKLKETEISLESVNERKDFREYSACLY